MSIENEIIKLTQSTESLLTTINTQKTVLDSAVSNATAQVTDAQSKVALTEVEKTLAETARNEAETHKDLAYTYSQSAASAVAYQDLTAIAESKVETAVDVFVYDTRKDSDGGAWRKRTQGTSWYNETLNTATRGSRKEFPAVAVIVAEATKVTIYDGDDPSLPMWMVFSQTAGGFLYNSAKSVFVVNGIFCCGTGTTLSQCDFISDVYFFRNTNGVKWNTNNVFYRNKVGGPYNTGTIPPIVNAQVNDVAMTVLPNAPIDPDTGLPIPTIAVATEGGVSVIKDDGSVVDITGFNVATTVVGFFKDNNLYCQGLWTSYIETFEIPPSDTTTSSRLARYYYGNSIPSFLDSGILSTDASVDFYKGSTGGLNVLSQNITPANGMINYITSTYNTGWMNGDIKLATLSDTDDTDLVGSELVTNGTFDTDVSGWTAVNSTLSVVNGKLRVTSSGGDWGDAIQNFPVQAGKTYVITIGDMTENTGDLYWAVQNSGINTGFFNEITKTATFTPTSTGTCKITLRVSQTAGDNSDYDNISVRLAEADRSVNNNGLQVFGTVQKNPVATGADLVAYSGFTTSNYLEQPYNPDLDFGTGDFCIMGWVNVPVGAYSTLLDRTDGNRSNPYFRIGTSTGGNFNLYLNSTSPVVTAPLPYLTDTFFAIVRKDGVAYIYVNGVLKDSAVSTQDITNILANLVVGYDSVVNDGAWDINGSLALLRISATAPTAEQIAKIYRDEKPLFQEGAQATLHGTSDAVTALAYDDSTELLHVGTSAGRSVFQGLERVDNTTDAVGIAISASNGLVVEE